MPLTRVGNKREIAIEIIKYFPPHDMYVELFFGAGGVFFSKPKAKYNILNDLDDNVYKFWMMLMNDEKREKLVEWLELTPYDERIYRFLERKKNFRDDVEQVGYFLINSNYTYLGREGSLKYGITNSREILIDKIKRFAKGLFENTMWMNCDFREALKKISLRAKKEKGRCFVYADPPYVGTSGYNGTPKWTAEDFIDLVSELTNFGTKFAISERNTDFVVNIAKQRGLKLVHIRNKQAIKARHNEILLLNYEPVIRPIMFKGGATTDILAVCEKEHK